MEIRSIKESISFIYEQYIEHMAGAEFDDLSDFEFDISGFDSDAKKGVVEEMRTLNLTDFSSFCDLFSLLLLEYYNHYQEESDNLIIEMMMSSSSREAFCMDFISNEYLVDDLVSIALDAYELDESYDYSDMWDAIQTEKGRQLYCKFHPYLEHELNLCWNYQKEKCLFQRAGQIKISHPFEFFLLSRYLKEWVSESGRIVDFLAEFLGNLEFEESLQRKIYSLLCQNFYAFMVTRQDTTQVDFLISKPVFDQMCRIEPSDFIEASIHSPVKTKVLLRSFLLFHPLSYAEVFPSMSLDDKKLLKRYDAITFQSEKK